MLFGVRMVLPGWRDPEGNALPKSSNPKIPSGYVKIAMENHHFEWENPLFLWPFSIAMLVYQRVQGSMDLQSQFVINDQ